MKYSGALFVLFAVTTFAGSACSGGIESEQSMAKNVTKTCSIKDLGENWKIYKAMNKHLAKGARVNIQYFPATTQPPQPERVKISGNLKADSWDAPSCNGSVAMVTGRVKVEDCEHSITLSQDNNNADNWPADCSGLGQDKQECIDEAFTRHLVIQIKQIDVNPKCQVHNTGEHLVGDHGSTAHGGN